MSRKITKKLEPSTFGSSAVGRPENLGGKVMEGHLKKKKCSYGCQNVSGGGGGGGYTPKPPVPT